MRNLLPFIFILACPVMMIFMMRGMHGGGHGTSKAGNDVHAGQDMRMGHQMGQDDPAAPHLQAPDERIAALEHELVQLRSLQSRQSNHDRARRP